MSFNLAEDNFDDVEGLHFCKSCYHVYDEFHNLVSGVCPFCFAKKHYISILIPDLKDEVENMAFCPICFRQYNMRSWEISDEIKEQFRKKREEKFVEMMCKQIEKRE